MSGEDTRDGDALEVDLVALRAALREVRAPDDEAALLARYRERAPAPAHPHAPERAALPRAAASRARFAPGPVALAAAAALAAVTALVALRTDRAERAVAPGSAGYVAAERGPPEPAAAFRPLAFARGVSAAESYSVVRVRIELPASAAGAVAPVDAAIEADLLVGEDGLARAIRFDRADTLFVSAAANEIGERR